MLVKKQVTKVPKELLSSIQRIFEEQYLSWVHNCASLKFCLHYESSTTRPKISILASGLSFLIPFFNLFKLGYLLCNSVAHNVAFFLFLGMGNEENIKDLWTFIPEMNSSQVQGHSWERLKHHKSLSPCKEIAEYWGTWFLHSESSQLPLNEGLNKQKSFWKLAWVTEGGGLWETGWGKRNLFKDLFVVCVSLEYSLLSGLRGATQ